MVMVMVMMMMGCCERGQQPNCVLLCASVDERIEMQMAHTEQFVKGDVSILSFLQKTAGSVWGIRLSSAHHPSRMLYIFVRVCVDRLRTVCAYL
jgi:hypothetical protein